MPSDVGVRRVCVECVCSGECVSLGVFAGGVYFHKPRR